MATDLFSQGDRQFAAAQDLAGGVRPLSLSQKEDWENRDRLEVGWSMRDDDCPLDGSNAFDRTTGEIAWRPTCKNARCRRCSRQVSAQTFALARTAMREQDRVRFVTLTQVAEGWQAAREDVRGVARELRRRGYRNEWLYVLERGDETGMKHAHCIQHGDFIPFDELKEIYGGRRVEISAARSDVDGYLAKNVVRYVGKGLDGDGPLIEAHMNLNGGRAAHWTRGFFNGLSRDGYRKRHPLPGIYFIETARPC